MRRPVTINRRGSIPRHVTIDRLDDDAGGAFRREARREEGDDSAGLMQSSVRAMGNSRRNAFLLSMIQRSISTVIQLC